MKKILFTLIVFISFLYSCKKETVLENDFNLVIDSRYKPGLFDSIPTNLSDVNSEYDDYNSAYPPGIWGYEKEIAFSTNRNSKGANYDFIYYNLTIMHNLIDDTLIEIKGTTIFYDEDNLDRRSYNYVNTQYDELGPYYWKTKWDNINKRDKSIFLYSNNSSGNQDIKCIVYNECSKAYDLTCSDTVSDIISLTNVNTNYNELYPSIRDNKLYFTSDREGNYNIYSIDILEEDLFNSQKLELSDKPEKINELSGPYDEKCPFVYDSIMVFSSNSKVGFGGFDLWYSIKTNNEWSTPKNFGKNINSEYDEYRPIIIPLEESGNNLMIFSSNRPGGKGGFDLYYVGIQK